ncbi:MAG: hypothetical protein ABI353_03130 [Isosphaeraceae bacterium]
MRTTRDLIPVPCLAVILAVGVTLGGLLVGYEPVGGDPDRMYRPIKVELAAALHQGRLPFWSERFGLGVPLVADSHVAAFYPPNLVFYRILDVSTAYRLLMWFHYLLIGIATYLYAKGLSITPWGSAVAALSFTLCGFQTIHSSHEPFYHVMPFLPLCLLLADRYATTGRTFWTALLALAWGAQLTLGHFQIQMWTAVLVLVTGFWRIASERRPWGRGLGLALALAWGAAIAAVQLGPTWELAKVVGQTRRSFADLAFYSYPPAHWAELAIPSLFRGLRGGSEAPYWFSQQTTGFEACLFVGTVPLILAFFGLIGSGKRDALTPWRWIVPASFALATMPRWWPLGYASLLQLPGPGYFRCPARYTAITSFGLALLAGRGLDRAFSNRRFRIGLTLAAFFALASLVWALVWTTRPAFRSGLDDAALAARLGLAALTWTLGFLVLGLWRRGRLGPWGLVLLTALEMGALYHVGTTQWGWSVPLPASSPVLTFLSREPGVGRVGGALDNLPVRGGLTTATPYVGFPLPPPHDLLKASQSPRNADDPAVLPWLQRFGVTHAVWDGSVPTSLGETVFLGNDPALDLLAYRPAGAPERRLWRVVRLPSPLPTPRVALHALVVADRRTLIDGLSRQPNDDAAWYLAADAPPEPRTPRARSARVLRWTGRSGEVEHDGSCDLILDRMAYPGWTVQTNDGPERPVLSANGGLQVVRLDGSGTSQVRLRFRPTGFVVAAVVSLIATLAAVAVVGFALVRRSAGSGKRLEGD